MPTQPPFHQSPQRYNKSRQKAAEATHAMVSLMQKGSRTILGTVADTSFHLTQGYVTCTTQLGVVQVAGIPLGTVLPGMRVYCRRLGTMSSNRSYIFDGYAATISSLGPNGSLIVAGSPTLSAGCAMVASVSSVSGVTGPTGYYWHCFFYVPSIPTGTVTLFQFAQTGAPTTTFTVQMTTACLIQVVSNDGHGYTTTSAVVPHQLHWLVIQPGMAGSELLIDGLSAYTGLLSGGDEPTFTGNATTSTLSLGANVNGTQLLPIGSWLSKVGYGHMTSLFPVVIPQYDTDLVNTSGTLVLYLFEDTPGSSTAINSASGVGAGTLTISNPASLVMAGPY